MRAAESRKEGIQCGARCDGRQAGGRRAIAGHAACRAGLDCRFGAGHGEERTENIQPMSVTLEVSKLSGWLNADAYCRESNGGHTVLGEVRAGRREVASDCDAGSVQGRARLQIEGRGHGEERTPNM